MPSRIPTPRWRGRAVVFLVTVAALGAAAVVSAARTPRFTLSVAHHAAVTDFHGTTRHQDVLVDTAGFVVYTLGGDSQRHPECTKANGCFLFWPPVGVSAKARLSKAPGISGKLGIWHRGKLSQLTLDGHPLYTYAGDFHRGTATGEGINSFGGIWHVRAPNSARSHLPSPTHTSTPPAAGSAPSSPSYPLY